MFGFIITFFYFNPSNLNSLKCVSMNNQECRARTKIININNNEPVFYPCFILIIVLLCFSLCFRLNKCNGSCNINDPSAKLSVPDAVKK